MNYFFDTESKNKIIDAIFLGTIDDIYEPLTNRLKKFVWKVTGKAEALHKTAFDAHRRLATMPFVSRKDAANEINAPEVPREIRGFFFSNIQKYLDSDPSFVANVANVAAFSDVWTHWLKENYTKFDWKGE